MIKLFVNRFGNEGVLYLLVSLILVIMVGGAIGAVLV